MKDLPIKCRNLSTVTLPINPEGDSEPLTWEECTAAREGLQIHFACSDEAQKVVLQLPKADPVQKRVDSLTQNDLDLRIVFPKSIP